MVVVVTLSTFLSIYLSIYPSIYLSIYASILLSFYLPIYLSTCNLENEPILRDFLKFWPWQHQKRSNAARLPQVLNMATSKTKQFCEISEVLHLSRKIILANPKISCSKMKPFSGNPRPDLPTHLIDVSLVLRVPREMHLCRSSSNAPPLPSFWNCYKTLTFCSLLTRCTIPCACHGKRHLNIQKCSVPLSFFHFWLRNVLRATTACTFSTSQLPKVLREWCALYISIWKCASRHKGLHFFRHLNFQKWSEREVLFSFSLACASGHNGVPFFHLSSIWPDVSAPAALASLLFDPPAPQIIGKTPCFATFLPVHAPASSFFWLFLFSDRLSSSLLFSDSSHLSFSICPYCRKFDF